MLFETTRISRPETSIARFSFLTTANLEPKSALTTETSSFEWNSPPNSLDWVQCSQSSDLNRGAYSYVRFGNYSKKLRQRLEANAPLLAKSVLCFAIDRIYYGDLSSR